VKGKKQASSTYFAGISWEAVNCSTVTFLHLLHC